MLTKCASEMTVSEESWKVPKSAAIIINVPEVFKGSDKAVFKCMGEMSNDVIRQCSLHFPQLVIFCYLTVIKM